MRQVNEDLKFERSPRSVGDEGLKAIGLFDQELSDLFFHSSSVFLVEVPVIGVVESLVDQDPKLFLERQAFNLSDKNVEGTGSFNQN